MIANETDFTERLRVKYLLQNIAFSRNMDFYPSVKNTFLKSFWLYFGNLAFFQTILYFFIMNKDVNPMIPVYVMSVLSCFFIPFLLYLHFISFTHGLKTELKNKNREDEFVAFFQKSILIKKMKGQSLPEKRPRKRI